jgi:hypothetical protein
MAREQLQARFDADVVETVEQFADDKEISRSEAMRRALREGLMLHGYELDVPGDAERRDDAKYSAQQTGTLLLIGTMASSSFGSLLTLAAVGVL